MDGGLPTDQPKDWPSVEHGATIQHAVPREWTGIPEASRLKDPGLARLENGRLLEVAIEHRLMQCETLCYMLHQLPLDRKVSRQLSLTPVAYTGIAPGRKFPPE